MSRNLAKPRLTAAQLAALPAGTRVVDDDMDIATKRRDGLWEGYEMGPIPTEKLIQYGPIKRWYHGPRSRRSTP